MLRATCGVCKSLINKQSGAICKKCAKKAIETVYDLAFTKGYVTGRKDAEKSLKKKKGESRAKKVT